jgi:DNA-binding protein HU-beta
MKRAQLVNKLSMRMEVTKKEADHYITVFLDSIMETFYENGRVALNGFGSFNVNEHKARVMKKPLTNEIIKIPVRRKISFKPGKELRERVNTIKTNERKKEKLIQNVNVSNNVLSISAG